MQGALRKRLRRRALLAAWCVFAGVTTAAPASETGYRAYVPQAIRVASDAPYLSGDGSISIIGDDTMDPVLLRLNKLFVETHPGVRFTMLLKPPPIGIDGIVAGVSLFAPVAHDASDAEIEPFKRLTGFRPLDIHIGRLGYAGAHGQNPPAVYVHDSNPLRSLSLDEISRIFTTGQLPSDLRRWNQVGAGGANRAIHVYGTHDDGSYITTLRSVHFGGRPLAGNYEELPSDNDTLKAVSGDRYGIGVVGAVDVARIPKDVRMLALSSGGATSVASYDDVRRGMYPLAPYLHMYVRSAPGAPLEPVVKEYVRLALSREGQHIIETLKAAAPGFVPLTTDEAARQLAKIE